MTVPFAVKILFAKTYPICVITGCAETGRVPPASGVMVSAVELLAGFRTVKIELTTGVIGIIVFTTIV